MKILQGVKSTVTVEVVTAEIGPDATFSTGCQASSLLNNHCGTIEGKYSTWTCWRPAILNALIPRAVRPNVGTGDQNHPATVTITTNKGVMEKGGNSKPRRLPWQSIRPQRIPPRFS